MELKIYSVWEKYRSFHVTPGDAESNSWNLKFKLSKKQDTKKSSFFECKIKILCLLTLKIGVCVQDREEGNRNFIFHLYVDCF